MLSLSLRRSSISDIPEVMRINSLCLPENYSREFFVETLTGWPETFIVAEVDHRVVGYIMCRIETSFTGILRNRVTRRGHIVSVAVLGEHRRAHVGQELVKAALAALQLAPVEDCYLEVRPGNLEAIPLYLKLGFTTVKTIPRYYADGSEAYLMVKKLGSSKA